MNVPRLKCVNIILEFGKHRVLREGSTKIFLPLHNDAAYFKPSQGSLLMQFDWGLFSFY